jgi:diketogulonate reductase-like aldo/keto reductase
MNIHDVKTKSGKTLSKIGIGSYGIGGRGHRDVELADKQDDDIYIDALVHTLERSINFTEISLGYGHGQSLALFKQALDKSAADREDIFITNSLYPRDLADIEVVKDDLESFYKIMNTDYADSTLVTQDFTVKFGRDVTFALLDQLLESGRTRFVSFSNASPTWINVFKDKYGDKLYAHEAHISFEVREVQDKGVFDLCDSLNIKNIIWRPLRQNRTFVHNWELLVELAAKYKRTQSQIVLNWICSLGYSPMVMSASIEHIDENIASLDFQMSDDDYNRMRDCRPSNYYPPVVDWEGFNGGNDLVMLANNFEENLKSS